MLKNRISAGILSLVSFVTISAAAPITVNAKTLSDRSAASQPGEHHNNLGQFIRGYASQQRSMSTHAHGSAVHSYVSLYRSGILPEGIQPAIDPMYEVGDNVIITEGHMPGMQGATAVIVGAFDTYAYSVTYTPTTGGDPVYDHKWVVQEEIADAGDDPFTVGDVVILESDHMPGMEGASAVIESVENTTVYIIDYIPTNGMTIVRNHKWVTDHELAAAE